MYLYKYAILKFFLPNLWRKNHSHSSACTVCNGKYMYSSFKHLKEPKGMAEKVQTPTKEPKSREVTRETLLTQAIFEISVDRLNYALNAL